MGNESVMDKIQFALDTGRALGLSNADVEALANFINKLHASCYAAHTLLGRHGQLEEWLAETNRVIAAGSTPEEGEGEGDG